MQAMKQAPRHRQRGMSFIGVVLWAYNSKRKSSFDEAANLPFADDIPANKRDEQASGSNKE